MIKSFYAQEGLYDEDDLDFGSDDDDKKEEMKERIADSVSK